MAERDLTPLRYSADPGQLVIALEILANLIYLARIAPEGKTAQRFVALADEQIERVFLILLETNFKSA
jgi:hypothetical protein